MNTLSTILSSFALVISLVGALIAIGAARTARSTERWVTTNNKKSVGLAQLTQLNDELTEHADSIAHIHKTLKSLRSKIGMRNLRAKDDSQDDLPDPLRDPDGYKRAMRLKLHLQGKPNAK